MVSGLPSVVQKSQESFCPSPPKLPLESRSFKAPPPRPILPRDFLLSTEVQMKLEHHLRKRLSQHRWGLPHRIHDSLSHMCPPSELTDFSESRRISVFKHQGSRESHATVPRGSGNNGKSDSCAQEATVAKAHTYSQDTGQKDSLQSNSGGFREQSEI